MKFTELKKLSKETKAIASVVIETHVDGGWEIILQTIDTVENFINKLKDIKKQDAEIWCGILRDGDYLMYEDLIRDLDFEVISDADAEVLKKYNAFYQNELCLDI